MIALRLFGVVAGLATTAVAGLAGVRTLRRTESEAQVWFDLGMARRMRAAAAGLPLAGAALVGVAGSMMVGWALWGLGPVASARVVVPHATWGLPVVLAVGVASSALAILAVAFGAAAWRAVRARPAPSPARTSRSCGGANRQRPADRRGPGRPPRRCRERWRPRRAGGRGDGPGRRRGVRRVQREHVEPRR